MVQEREALTPGSNCPYHTIASMMGVVDKPSVTQDSGLRTQDSGLSHSVTQLLDFQMAHQVRILTDYCKGCELCVHACPKGMLEMAEELTAIGVRPARPKGDAQCTGCTLCYQVCPDAAIEIWQTEEA